MYFNSNRSDEEVHSLDLTALGALEKLDEITRRLTMDALNASDTTVSHPRASTSREHADKVTNRRKRSSMDSSIQSTDEEMIYRRKLYADPRKVLKEKIRCTACGVSLLKHVMKGLGLHFHPLLQVLVCQDCREFYGDGEFPLDDDNSDTYCRWCAQGGSLYCCSACSFVFCKPCIRRNFKQSTLFEIEEVDWKCFVCNPEALWKHRAVCWAAKQYAIDHPCQDKNSETSDDEPQRRRRRRDRKENLTGKGSARRKNKSRSTRVLEKDSEDESQHDDEIVKKKKSKRKSESNEEISPTPPKDKRKHRKEKKQEKGDEGEGECLPLDESYCKSSEEEVDKDAADDENARQISAMRKTCISMEKLTKETLVVSQSVSRKANLLHDWIHGKNQTSHKVFPTSPEKLGKMFASFKKILLGLHTHTEELQSKVTEVEQEWRSHWEQGENDKEKTGSEQEEMVNGNGREEDERHMQKENGDEENGMNGDEENGMNDDTNTIKDREEGSDSELNCNGVDDLENTSGVKEIEAEEASQVKNFDVKDDERNTSIGGGDGAGISDAETLCLGVNENGYGSEGEKTDYDVGEHGGKGKADPNSDVNKSDDKLEDGDKASDDASAVEKEVQEDEKREKQKENEEVVKASGKENVENSSAIVVNHDKCKESVSMDAVETEDIDKQSKLCIGDCSANVNSMSNAELSFDIFEDAEQSPTNIPIPPSDSEDENEDADKEKDPVKDSKVKAEDSKGLAYGNRESDDDKSKKIEKIKPSKEDQDAKLALLLDSTSSFTDSDSDSSLDQRAVQKKKKSFSSSTDGKVVESELISQYGDKKLKAGCSVLIQKLHTCDHENIPVSSKPKKTVTVSKKDSIENAIKRLGNFKTLDKTLSNYKDSDDDSETATEKKSVKRKTSNKPKENNSDGGHSDPVEEATQLSLDEMETDERLKTFSDKETSEMDAFAKKMLFESSASDIDTTDENEEEPKKKKTAEKSSKSSKDEENIKEKKNSSNSSASDVDEKLPKKSRRKEKLLCVKLDGTDSSEEERKWKAKKQQQSERNVHRRRLASSSSDIKLSSADSSDSSVIEDLIKKRKRAPKSDSSEYKSSGSKTKKKQKRRRIKTVDTDSDASSDDNTGKTDSSNKGRKNIRKVLKGNKLGEETKQAAKVEEERMKRIVERQKMYNDIFTDRRDLKVLEKLVLDFDPETKKELVYVHPGLVKKLKPHQAEGVKFMWDACFESLKRMETEKGSGCILAHCMGLGKTLQVIALVHTLLFNPKTKVHTALVICPVNTVLNWVNEFRIWLKDLGSGNDVEVYEISKFKGNVERMYQLKEWQSEGGVMIIGYDLYRILVNPGGRMRKKIKEVFLSTLLDPGPDLVICDEGHLLKNTASALSKAVNAIKTYRRIVLTGTPLQNNLKEYHCMIQFVKPNLLGTHKEFLNRFVNPISNGQCADSTPHDVRVMKRRAHVLHKMLEGCVQRCDYSVLTPFLPPKHEFVICIRLTELQSKLYIHYLENFAQKASGGGASLFNDFQNLQRIWTHPRVLKMSTEREEKKKLMQSDSEGSLKDFIDDDTDESDTTESSSQSASSKSKKRKRMKRSCKQNNVSSSESSDIICLSDENKENDSKEKDPKEDEVEPPEQKAWWEAFVEEEDHDKVIHSGKLVLLLDILQKCELIGDKVLLFSQSLYSLNLIEHFLEQIDEKTQSQDPNTFTEEVGSEGTEANFVGSWTKGLDYFRIDGSVSGENRNIWCKSFNREDNLRARLFLISTRAGGMGINLVGANRVVLFDASWNPSSDLQSIFRIYRFGQKKPCYVYRFLAQGTMEEKIYNRQVTKLSLASRVLDEHQIERHFNFEDLQELYKYNPTLKSKRPTPMLPKDRLLAELLQKYSDLIDNYHEHDSLLENKAEEELTEEERKAAWEDFENEKKEKLPENIFLNMAGGSGGGEVGGFPAQMYGNQITNSIPGLLDAILKKHPNATEEQLVYELRLATTRLNQYFSRVGGLQQQQMYNHMAQQNQMLGNAPAYPRLIQPMPNQAALMQAHYGLQNYYHSPVLPSSSTNNSSMMLPPHMQNDASHVMPGIMNNLQQQLLLKMQKPPSNIPSTIQSAPEGNTVQTSMLKIRSDLMPPSNDDVIIESVKRRE